MLGPLFVAIMQVANPSGPLPDLEGAVFELRNCATPDGIKVCTYAARSSSDDGYDIYYLAVREGFYMVSARTVRCRGDLGSPMNAGLNFFYLPDGVHYRTGEGPGWTLVYKDFTLVCGARDPQNGLQIAEIYEDGQSRLADL